MNKKDEVERILDRVNNGLMAMKHELLAVVCAETPPPTLGDQPLPVWMDNKELAQYWKVKPETVVKWTKRKPNEHPLPFARMGDLLRFKREDCDRWAYEEGQLGNKMEELPTDKETKRRGLTAVAPPQGGQ